MGHAQLLLENLLSAGKADDHLPPIAPRRTAADTVGLQHHDLKAPLRQLNGRRQSGKASTHYHHIGVHCAI